MEDSKNIKNEIKRSRYKSASSENNIFEHGKIPPQAIELEEAVLGAMMLEQNALTSVIELLKPESFYKEAHHHIYQAITNLFNRQQPIDILTVTNELKTLGFLDIVGGPYYVTKLTNRIASSANIEFHARIIQEKYIQRELIRIGSEIVRDSFEESSDVLQLLDNAEKNLFTIAEQNLRRSYSDMYSILKDALKNIEIAKNSQSHLNGVPTGFSELDRQTGGWQKSDLIIIASRPGMGKTSFILSMARNMAIDYKKSIAIFSLEMSAVQLVTRLISAESGLPAEKLRRGDISDNEWSLLNSKIKTFEDTPIFIDDTPQLSIFELRAKARRLKQTNNISILFIDYLQLMTTTNESRGNRQEEISNISRSLKGLAKELDIPIVALSQLSRAVESRTTNKRPILSDLRESGAIEQDADLVLFIYRPEYYKIDEDDKGISTHGLAEINIAKHRNGPLADMNLKFISQFARFVDIDKDVQYESEHGGISPNEKFDLQSSVTMPSKMNEDIPESNTTDVPF